MSKVLLYFFPDVREIIISASIEVPFEECFDKIKIFCENYKGKLRTAQVLAYADSKELMFELNGADLKYEVKEKYKDIEPQVSDIFNNIFLNDPSIKDVKPPTVEELRNFDVIVEGFTEPSEFYYGADFQVKCKFHEALGVMQKMKEDYAERFPKLAFDVSTKDEHLFGTYHDEMDKIYLGRLNLLNLTEELIKEALGMK